MRESTREADALQFCIYKSGSRLTGLVGLFSYVDFISLSWKQLNAHSCKDSTIEIKWHKNRDEEIALRLQVEEFQAYPNLNGYDIARQQSSQSTEAHANTSLQNDINVDVHRGAYFIRNRTPDTRSSLDSFNEHTAMLILESQTDSIKDLNSRLHRIDIRDIENRYIEISNSGNADSTRTESDNDN